jgi:chromosomal replication initiation ATPase DnaA
VVPDAREALTRLRERIGPRAASLWLDGAKVVRSRGAVELRVPRPFARQRLLARYAEDLKEAFGGAVEVVSEAPEPPPHEQPRKKSIPRLQGPRAEFAVRMVKGFAKGDPAGANLLLLHGPPGSGKSLLATWARKLAGGRAFRLDLARVRAGKSRGLVPRKPLTVGEGVEALARREKAQRTLCTIIDAVQDRGDRLLFTLEGHPARAGLSPALRSRLLGGLLVRVEPAGAAPPAGLDAMKDTAARLCGVERSLLDGACRRRSVVEVRRAVMAAASRAGFAPGEIARSFGLRSERPVAEARAWAARQEARDRRFAGILDEVLRVGPRA